MTVNCKIRNERSHVVKDQPLTYTHGWLATLISLSRDIPRCDTHRGEPQQKRSTQNKLVVGRYKSGERTNAHHNYWHEDLPIVVCGGINRIKASTDFCGISTYISIFYARIL